MSAGSQCRFQGVAAIVSEATAPGRSCGWLPRVIDVGFPLLVISVREAGRAKAVPFVKIPGAGVPLRRREQNAARAQAESLAEQGGADTFALTVRINIEVIELLDRKSVV